MMPFLVKRRLRGPFCERPSLLDRYTAELKRVHAHDRRPLCSSPIKWRLGAASPATHQTGPTIADGRHTRPK